MRLTEHDKIAQAIVGTKVLEIDIRSAHDVGLRLSDGRVLSLWLDADCCSHSYFSDVANQFHELVGATILEIDERSGGDDPKKYPDSDDSGESISWHFLVFKTDKGHVTFDWRNDSNGYYDGWLTMELDWEPPCQ